MSNEDSTENELETYTPEEIVEHSFVRTQVTANHETNREEKQWEVIRDECDAGEALDERCNVVAASLGKGVLDVVAKRLACGCLMVALDDIDQLGWDIGEIK